MGLRTKREEELLEQLEAVARRYVPVRVPRDGASGPAVDRLMALDVLETMKAAGAVLLPARIGDRLYIIHRRKVVPVTVTSVSLSSTHAAFVVLRGHPNEGGSWAMRSCAPEDIGRTVWLSEQEARAALETRGTGE